jgi:hypothetical protein
MFAPAAGKEADTPLPCPAACLPLPALACFWFCPQPLNCPQTQPSARFNITRKHMEQLVESIQSLGYHYVMIDCPAGIDVGFINAISPAKEALIVTTPEITSIRWVGLRVCLSVDWSVWVRDLVRGLEGSGSGAPRRAHNWQRM